MPISASDCISKKENNFPPTFQNLTPLGLYMMSMVRCNVFIEMEDSNIRSHFQTFPEKSLHAFDSFVVLKYFHNEKANFLVENKSLCLFLDCKD